MAKRTSTRKNAGSTQKKRKRLTPVEKQMIVKAHARAVKFVSGQRLDPEKRDHLLSLVETLKQRRKPVVGKEAIALWSAKIDWAIVNGDVPKVVKLIKLPLGPEALPRETQLWDSNGNCGCGGDGGGGA